VNKIFIKPNIMKLKVPTSNLVKFEITRVRFGINRRKDLKNLLLRDIEKLCKCVCAGRKIKGHGRYFLKSIYIYIYIWVQVSVCCKETKKKEQTWFFKEKEAFGQERKNKFKLGKFVNLKVLKLWLLLGKVPSHF
jgi:hypothetical protein